MPLSKDQAEALFLGYRDDLWKCVVDYGFGRYKKCPYRSSYRRATTASLIHDLMVFGAREVFEGDSSVRFIDVKGTDITLMEIDEQVIIWFKKLGNGRQARGNETDNSRKLMTGTAEDIPGVAPRATVVHVGYTPNRDETDVARVSVVRPSAGKRPEWFFDLMRPKDAMMLLGKKIPSGEPEDGTKTKITVVASVDQSKLVN